MFFKEIFLLSSKKINWVLKFSLKLKLTLLTRLEIVFLGKKWR